MSDFHEAQWAAMQAAFLTTVSALRAWVIPQEPACIELGDVEPGDFATRHDRDDAAIRAHNNAWSHQWTPCWATRQGAEL
jgi:hypothetical protein